jgi:hypothetical protein
LGKVELDIKVLTAKNTSLSWSNRILCPIHRVWGKPKVKAIKGRRHLYRHHRWLKQAVDCYVGRCEP